MTHELKCDPEPFEAMRLCRKTFELRLDDGRNFQVGDCLFLRETKHTGLEMKNGAPLEYTGRTRLMAVLYLLRGPAYGIPSGFVIMS